MNPEILNYFQQNLARDSRGYYIINRFGERTEHGYLAGVFGFPLRVQSLRPGSASEWDLLLQGGQRAGAATSALRFIDNHTLAVILPGGIPARLSGTAMADLAEYIVQTEPVVVTVHGKTTTVPNTSLEALFGDYTSSSERVDPSSSSGMSTMESPI